MGSSRSSGRDPPHVVLAFFAPADCHGFKPSLGPVSKSPAQSTSLFTDQQATGRTEDKAFDVHAIRVRCFHCVR